MVAAVCFGKLFTVSRTKPRGSVITTFLRQTWAFCSHFRHEGPEFWDSALPTSLAAGEPGCHPAETHVSRAVAQGPGFQDSPPGFPAIACPLARRAYTLTSPVYLTYTSGFEGLQPKHCAPCLGCARHHSNYIQLPSRHKEKKKAHWPEHAPRVLETQGSCCSSQRRKMKIHTLPPLLQPLLYCLHITL